MSYWFTDPFLKELGPLAKSTAVRGLSFPFSTPRIFAGANTLLALPGPLGMTFMQLLATRCPRKMAFIVTDNNSQNHAGLVATIMQRNGFTVQSWAEAQPEVPIENARACASTMMEHQPDVIVAVGGGSVIDCAKAAWVLYERPDVTNLGMLAPFQPFNLRHKAILVAIPTTSGTGSECTSAAVLTDTAANRKIVLASPELMPDYAVLFPEFPMTMPPRLTANTGLDVLAHAVDACMCPAANDLTDAISLRSIQMTFKYLPRAYQEGTDREARFRMHLASAMAGIAFVNSGTALTHAIGHSVGKIFSVHHGLMVGFFVPYALQYYAPVTDKYLEIAAALGIKGSSKKLVLASLVAKFKEFYAGLDVPPTLLDMKISRQDFEANIDKMVLFSLEDLSSYASPRPMVPEECRKFLWCSFEGRDIDF